MQIASIRSGAPENALARDAFLVTPTRRNEGQDHRLIPSIAVTSHQNIQLMVTQRGSSLVLSFLEGPSVSYALSANITLGFCLTDFHQLRRNYSPQKRKSQKGADHGS